MLLGTVPATGSTAALQQDYLRSGSGLVRMQLPPREQADALASAVAEPAEDKPITDKLFRANTFWPADDQLPNTARLVLRKLGMALAVFLAETVEPVLHAKIRKFLLTLMDDVLEVAGVEFVVIPDGATSIQGCWSKRLWSHGTLRVRGLVNRALELLAAVEEALPLVRQRAEHAKAGQVG